MASQYPKIVQLTAAGTSGWIPIDLGTFRNGVGLVATISDGGSAAYSVEVTGDRLDSAPVYWNPHDLLRDLTCAANGNLAYPVTAVRLNAATVVSGTTLQLSVIQVTG